MKDEIERKFLVRAPFLMEAINRQRIEQGYISVDPERTVRVRRFESGGELTIKGKSTADGLVRKEFERELSTDEANMLFELCTHCIVKERLDVLFEGKVWSVDIFKQLNSGLILAEVELYSVDEDVKIPSWAYKEVTGDIRYYNSYLSSHPYTTWPENQA